MIVTFPPQLIVTKKNKLTCGLGVYCWAGVCISVCLLHAEYLLRAFVYHGTATDCVFKVQTNCFLELTRVLPSCAHILIDPNSQFLALNRVIQALFIKQKCLI